MCFNSVRDSNERPSKGYYLLSQITLFTNVQKIYGVKKVLDIISGDLNTVGSEVAIGDEHFYIISNTDGEKD